MTQFLNKLTLDQLQTYYKEGEKGMVPGALSWGPQKLLCLIRTVGIKDNVLTCQGALLQKPWLKLLIKIKKYAKNCKKNHRD